jgi:membrane protein
MTDDAGRTADDPREIGGRGWKAIALRTKEQFRSDNVTILAAGVAFYLLLALAPALVAVLAIYGLVADPADVGTHLQDVSAALPADMRDLLDEQLRTAASASSKKLGIGLVVGMVAAVLGASKGARSLIEAINVAYDETETRGFLRLRLLALATTLGGLVIIIVALVSLTVLPTIGDEFGSAGRLVASIARWPLLAALMGFALAAMYRFAPDRDDARWRWVTPGALAAVVIWLGGSVAFTLYADHFGSFAETYGALGAVVVLMLWLFLTAMAVLVGAEINGETERQTVRDSTVGEQEAMGRRGAYAADTVGADPSGDAAVAPVGSDAGR